MSNPISSYLGLQADALPLREQRMKLIASNLANADTPGFQARDLDFNAALANLSEEARLELIDGDHSDGYGMDWRQTESSSIPANYKNPGEG